MVVLGRRTVHVLDFLLLSALVCVAALSCMLLSGENAFRYISAPLHEISVIGKYRADGGEWHKLEADTIPDFSNNKYVEIRGRFSQNIPDNVRVLLRIQYLGVTIDINGRRVFTFGAPSSIHRLARSEGDVWTDFESHGISVSDDVVIKLRDIYNNPYLPCMEKFLGNMYYGTGGALYRKLFAERGFSALLALCVFVLGIAEMTAVLLLLAMKYKNVRKLFYSAGYTISSAVWFFIQNDFSFLMPTTAFIAYLEIISMFGTQLFFVLFISEYLTDIRRFIGMGLGFCALVFITLLSILQMCGIAEAYSFLNGTTFFSLLSIIVVVFMLLWELVLNREEHVYAITLTAALIPLVALADALVYTYAPGNYAIFMQIGSVITVLLLGGFVVMEYKTKIDAAARLEKIENELTQNRVAIMISQIQPHFLYNALATMKALCSVDPELAESAIAHFSKYLRQNLDSLTSKELVPFEQELLHIENYLYIEKIRFQGKINFVYKISAKEFYLPPLSVQPLVENAIRYGVGALSGGGTVTIASYEEKSGFVVTVSDNGRGFDFMSVARDDRKHVGIENARNRIEIMCGGTLTVQSESGKGTVIKIFIPKGAE